MARKNQPRVKTPRKITTVYLDADDIDNIDNLARQLGISRSALVNKAITLILKDPEKVGAEVLEEEVSEDENMSLIDDRIMGI